MPDRRHPFRWGLLAPLTGAVCALAVVAAAPAAGLAVPPTVTTAALAAPTASTAPATAPAPALVITEIAPDTVSYDDYEYFEVHNTTGADIDLTAAGVALFYTFVDSDDRTRDVALTYPEGTVVPAGGTVVFWLTYTSATVTAPDRTEEEFRAHWAAGAGESADYPLVRVTGQPGMANGGDRGIRLVAGEHVTWSYYPAGSVGPDRTAHFRLPADGGPGLDVLAAQAAPSPGTVAPEALVPAEPEPTPDPTEDPTAEPTEEPTEAPTGQPTEEPTPEPTEAPTEQPTDGPAEQPGREPDPNLVAAPLQITEVVPDTSNVGGADAYEFIEIYNATAEPVGYGDFTLDYLYPLEDLTNSNVVTWPAKPADLEIAPGGTIVLWVKNGSNDHLTDADFNAHYGSDLALGTDLAEIYIGGMANGSPRGLEIVTNTGFPVNKAYYNLGGVDDVDANVGIHYAHDPADTGRQQLLRKEAATPGAVAADQVPGGLVVPVEDTGGPAVTDRTAAEIDPAADFAIAHTVTDDVQARTVTVHVRNSSDPDFVTHNVRADGADGYTHVVPAADLTGKRWYEYYVTASDGTHVTTTELTRVPVAGVDQSPVRLNVADGQFLAGEHTLAAAGDTYPAGLTLAIDGEQVPTEPALESEPVFIFEAGGVDTYFRNGVKVGEDVLRIFDEGIYSGTETIAAPVPLSYVTQGEQLTVSVWAGTKAAPEIDPDENNDDFQIQNLRLVLPDGRTLRPAGYEDPAQVTSMGDSAGKLDYLDAVFTLPDDAFRALAHTWDTTAAADGEHTVSATDGETTAQASVVVDNTAPVITPSVSDGQEVRGEVALDADVTDAGSGVESVTATLDGNAVELPHTVSSLDLPAGEHVLAIEATDKAGNTATEEVRFTTPVEQPSVDALDFAVQGRTAQLSATVSDPSGDPLDVSFREGHRLTPGSGVEAYAGETRVAAGTERDGRQLLTGADLEALTGTDGLEAVTTSEDAFPYQLFEVAVPGDAGDDARVRVAWDGSANPGARVLLYVRSTATGAWVEVDRHVTSAVADGNEAFTLEALVPAADHVQDGSLTVLVQHSEGFAGENLSTRESAVEPHHSEDTPRSEYDFTLGWLSDTQYYNESFYDHQLAMNEYLLAERADLNLQYVFHTGDIVDDWDDMAQWDRADAAYRQFDEAGLPYGVLAGNHDVGSKLLDWSNYTRFFGAERYQGNPWHGQTYADNRGHYDLVSAGGIDFLMLYMGWDPGADEIAWLNEVLAQYPERVAILNLHEYMLTTGGLGPIPQQIYDEVVATNPNVKMVFSGHYHDAYTRVDDFDDDGDGSPDRSVYQVLFDYQGLPEGGLGYLRLLHFDNAGEQIVARTYSPSLHDYDADDATLEPEHQDFTVPYAALGIVPQEKVLATDSVVVEVLTTAEVASFEGVAAGETVTAERADLSPGEHGWYVVITDPYGAEAVSPVQLVTIAGGPGNGTPPPHAGQPGRPDHAGQQGPPAHSGKGQPANAGGQGKRS